MHLCAIREGFPSSSFAPCAWAHCALTNTMQRRHGAVLKSHSIPSRASPLQQEDSGKMDAVARSNSVPSPSPETLCCEAKPILTSRFCSSESERCVCASCTRSRASLGAPHSHSLASLKHRTPRWGTLGSAPVNQLPVPGRVCPWTAGLRGGCPCRQL